MKSRYGWIFLPIVTITGCGSNKPDSGPVSSSFSLSENQGSSDLHASLQKYLEAKKFQKGDAFLDWDRMYQPGLDWMRTGSASTPEQRHLQEETIRAVGHTIFEISGFMSAKQGSVRERYVAGVPPLLSLLKLNSIIANPPSGFSQSDIGVIAKDARAIAEKVMHKHHKFRFRGSLISECEEMKSHAGWTEADCRELSMKLDIATPIMQNACARRLHTEGACKSMINAFRVFVYRRRGPPEYVAFLDACYDAYIEAVDFTIGKPIPPDMSLNDWEKRIAQLLDKGYHASNQRIWETSVEKQQSLDG